MKFRKIAAMTIALCMVSMAAVACSKDSDSDDETAAAAQEESVDTEVEEETDAPVDETTEPTESTLPFVEPGVPFDHDAYYEFEEPVYYDVIAEAPAYLDVGLNRVEMTYVQGSMVTGVASDGRFIVLDNGYVVDGQYLEAYE